MKMTVGKVENEKPNRVSGLQAMRQRGLYKVVNPNGLCWTGQIVIGVEKGLYALPDGGFCTDEIVLRDMILEPLPKDVTIILWNG